MAPRIALFILALFVHTACSYGYAGREGQRRSEREYKPTVPVVTINEDPDDADAKPTKPAEPAEPESPCGRATFEIFYYTGSTQVTKTVDCLRRSVVDVKRGDIPEDTYARAQSSGLPEASWYLLVDPTGEQPTFLNNAQLLKLSRQFSIDYYGRDTTRNLLVYLYQQEDVQ